MGLFDDTNKKEDGAQTVQAPAQATKVETTEKTAKQMKKDAKRDALEKICAFIADEKNKVPAEIVECAKLVRPSFFGISVGGGFAKAEFRAWQTKLMQLLGVKEWSEIKVGSTFDEMKAFQTLKVGRREMHSICVDLIKTPGEKEAVYVSFDAVKGIYKVEGIGSQPEGWTGYVPAVAE